MSLSLTQNEVLELLPYLSKRERVELDRLLQTPANKAPEFRGAALAIQSLRVPEWLIHGPAETGKTVACLYLLDCLARQYPKAILCILRKVHKDLYGPGNVVEKFEKVYCKDGVTKYGGEKPEWFDYPNGSRIYIGGLDRPGAFLSGALDFAYVNQAEELFIDDWETLSTRTTGRAGNVPCPMLFGDCNPGPPSAWFLHREGLVIKRSRHEENPALFTADGVITEQGKRTMAVLDKLTGVRKERLRFGRDVSAEGTVYQFNPALHEIDPFPIPADWRRVEGVDFGFTNPFVYQWWAIDGDGRMYLYREIYMTQRTVKKHSRQVHQLRLGVDKEAWDALDDENQLKLVRAYRDNQTQVVQELLKVDAETARDCIARAERIDATVADHDAEDRATLEENDIYTVPANKDVSTGIEKVQTRLEVAGDGKPRLFVFRGALVERDESLAAKHLPVCTRDEFDAYSWPKAGDGKPVKDAPVKMHDHGMDNARYVVRYIDDGPSWLVYGL